MITDCVCEAVAFNAERKDKCCSTDDKELYTVAELSIELIKLKKQLRAASEKHKSELQELKQEKIKLENKNEDSTLLVVNKSHSYKQLFEKCKELIEKCVRVKSKYSDLKKAYEYQLNERQRQQSENSDIRKIALAECKKKRYYEKLHTLSQEENSKLKAELLTLKEQNETLLKEKETWSATQATLRDSLSSRDSCMSSTNQFSTKSDVEESTNEGTEFHKSISHYGSKNEDDFWNPVKKEYVDARVEEIKRRNSLYPSQLERSFPLEADLNATHHSLYVQDKCSEQHQNSKKQKLEALELQMPSHYIVKTPARRADKKSDMPESFRRYLKKRCSSNRSLNSKLHP